MAGLREAHVAARRRLIMLRHGQTPYNATGRIQGQLDTQLSDVGREQARTAAQYLAEAKPRITKIVSSDLARAADTVRTLAEVTGAELSFDKRLCEINLGEWQECIYDEIDSALPGMRDHRRHNFNWAPKGGETRFEASNRMLAVTAELAANLDWESDIFVLVSHGGVIAAATMAPLQMPRDHFSTFNGLGNTAWIEMEQRTRVSGEAPWCLNVFNMEVREREPQASDSSGGRHVR